MSWKQQLADSDCGSIAKMSNAPMNCMKVMGESSKTILGSASEVFEWADKKIKSKSTNSVPSIHDGYYLYFKLQ